jgi:predicted Zn-dependent protease
MFEGGAFHPDLPGGRRSGKLGFGMDVLWFRTDDEGFELPVDGLVIESGGASDRLIFFKHPNQPKAVVHTADRRVLDHPMLMQNAGLARQRARVRSQRHLARTVLFGVIAALIGVLALLFGFRHEVVKLAARAIPAEWEVSAGDAIFKQIAASERLITDPEILADLEKLTGPLVAAIKDARYPLKFHIIENATMNAFAMPGGHVVLHTGLLLAAETPEEVAGVLAHEIAHVTQRHGVRGVLSSAGMFIILQTLLGDVTGLAAVLTDNSSFLLSRRFSRDFEREADDHGWDYLLAANIRPDGMIRFFQRLHEMEKRLNKQLEEIVPVEAGGALQLASTHPATAERIQALQMKWTKLPASRIYQDFDLNYAAFKDRLRDALHTSDSEPPE